MSTWLITGCSSGLGREIAKAVLARGWNAVVTARDRAAVADLVADRPATALALPLDVTNRKQIVEAVTASEARFGAIDVLVNNAGYSYRAAVEEGEDDEVRRMFDTNFFGLVDVTKAVLPGMRARHRGHIVNISSFAGRLANPGAAYYAASKHAVNGLSDGLAKELAPLGIKVTIAEPGLLRTDFGRRSIQATSRPIEAYLETAGKQRALFAAHQGREPGDPARAALAIIKAVESDTPPLHLLLGASTLQRIEAELDRGRRELEAWRATTVWVDFPG
jgi:NAD(P)-dependent dehydrogenase (short-subunit alcohol dehydrogenase family)